MNSNRSVFHWSSAYKYSNETFFALCVRMRCGFALSGRFCYKSLTTSPQHASQCGACALPVVGRLGSPASSWPLEEKFQVFTTHRDRNIKQYLLPQQTNCKREYEVDKKGDIRKKHDKGLEGCPAWLARCEPPGQKITLILERKRQNLNTFDLEAEMQSLCCWYILDSHYFSCTALVYPAFYL